MLFTWNDWFIKLRLNILKCVYLNILHFCVYVSLSLIALDENNQIADTEFVDLK